MKENNSFAFLNGSIEPFTIIKDVMKKILIIFLLAVAISRLVFIAVDVTYVPEYTATGTYVVSQRSESYAYGNLSAAMQTAESMGKILESSVLKKKVCEEMGLNYFPGTAVTSTIPETNLMSVSMTAPTPELAYRLLVSVMENYHVVSDYLLGDVVMEVLEAPVVPTGASNYVDAYTPKEKAFEYTFLILLGIVILHSLMKDTIRMLQFIRPQLHGVAHVQQ
jgi:capsular polysaccharide biosynthesis protein